MVTAEPVPAVAARRFLATDRLRELIEALGRDGRQVIGPRLVDGAIRLAPVASAEELPFGIVVDRAPGRVAVRRLAPDEPGSRRAFDHAAPASGIKPWTFPATVDALHLESTGDGLAIRVEIPEGRPLAILGARACDLAALGVHDRVLVEGPTVDPDYASRRRDLLIVAVECAVAGSTCFCSSMGTGPEVTAGADLVLSELDHGFVIEARTAAGEAITALLDLPVADAADVGAARSQVARTRASMPVTVEAEGLHDRLLANLDHPRWDAIAERCLACGNCTLVCPTCFCTGTTVDSDLDGQVATVQRRWDSCFTEGFAQVAGGNFRPQPRDRYRQWLTHKFGTWWDQFGSSGCVGCGRCIEWCPVGIDIREELSIIAAAPVAGGAAASRPAGRAPLQMLAIATAPARDVPAVAGQATLDFHIARVAAVSQETADTATLRLQSDDPALLAGRPGQFVMAAMPGFASPPISISRFHPDGIDLTIRAAGAATSVLTKLVPGAEVGLRGPLGRPWPIEDALGRDVVIVGGGIGLAPLRGVIDAVLADRDRFGEIRLYLGARTPRERLYVAEIDALAARPDLNIRVTVDRAGPEWLGRVGIVTELFRSAAWAGSGATAFICGPERMMRATAEVLADLGVPPEHLWLTFERRMECGVGLCGHCQMGGRFVCRDGPVFSVAELGDDLRREGW